MPRIGGHARPILAALGVTTFAGPALAEPVANDSVTDPTVVRTRAGIETRVATFHLPGGSGRYETVALSFDAAAAGIVSVRAIVPFHELKLDPLPARTGVGDFDLKLKIRVLETKRWVVATGVDAQYPTGSAAKGIGGGALQIAPFATAGYEISKTILYGTAIYVSSFRPPGAAEQTSFVDPSTDREMAFTLGVIARLDSTFLLNASVTEIVMLTDAQRGDRLTILQPQLGVAFTKEWRGTLGFELPILGEHRFEARGTLGVFHFF